MRSTTFALALVLAVSAGASSARADDAEESRFHDELGRQHYEAHRFEQALREFFEAARLAPSPAITFNIAVCFDLLHRADEAYLFFNEYMASDDTDPERRRFATAATARLEAHVARVQVTSEPAGGLIYVDQRDHGSYGLTPRVLALPPGEHTITIERGGYRSVTVTVTAREGEEVAASGTLTQIVGTLHVASAEGGTVEVREAGGPTLAHGAAPLDATLPPGLYEVEVQADGYRPFTSVSRVSPDARTDMQVALEALPPPTGDLTVTSSAAGALIQLDGEPAGFAPTLMTGLSLGEHRVHLEHPGLAPYDGTVTIDENARGWLTVTLEEPPTTDRSPLTWAVGGIGVAALVAGAIVGGFAISNHDQFEAAQMQIAGGHMASRSPGDLRATGESLNLTTDVLLGVGLVAMVTAVVLYFVTEHTDIRQSRAAFSAGER
jgi:outer membrane receptor for ferrienterochelin and colicins